MARFFIPTVLLLACLAASYGSTTRFSEHLVAFFATLTRRYVENLAHNQNIVFENVVTNLGNGYDNSTGSFIAPVNGLYQITTSVLSQHDEEFWAAIVVSGTEVVRLNGRGTDNRHGTGTQTLTIWLNKGDEVSIQVSVHNQGVAAFWGDKYSSFGGFLIREENESVIVGYLPVLSKP